MPAPILPDPVVAARTALLAQPTLTALVDTRIWYALPETWPQSGGVDLPLLVLSLVDDDEVRPDALIARVQVDVWGSGGNKQHVLDCKAIAAVVRSVARDLKGTWGGASIYAAVAGQIIPNPDTSGRARFIVDLQLELQ